MEFIDRWYWYSSDPLDDLQENRICRILVEADRDVDFWCGGVNEVAFQGINENIK